MFICHTAAELNPPIFGTVSLLVMVKRRSDAILLIVASLLLGMRFDLFKMNSKPYLFICILGLVVNYFNQEQS